MPAYGLTIVRNGARLDYPFVEVEALLIERLMFRADYKHWVTTYPERFKYLARIVTPHIGMYSIRDASSFAVFDDWSTNGRYPLIVEYCEKHRPSLNSLAA